MSVKIDLFNMIVDYYVDNLSPIANEPNDKQNTVIFNAKKELANFVKYATQKNDNDDKSISLSYSGICNFYRTSGILINDLDTLVVSREKYKETLKNYYENYELNEQLKLKNIKKNQHALNKSDNPFVHGVKKKKKKNKNRARLDYFNYKLGL